MKKYLLVFLTTVLVFFAFNTPSFADTPILKPGETYVMQQYKSKGDLFNMSGPEYHSFEITTYSDGSAGCVYKVGLYDFDEKEAFKVNLTGKWKYTSQHDQRVVRIFVECDTETRYLHYIIYVDAKLNAYLGDMNNAPTKLYLKKDLTAAKLQQEAAERERERLDEEMYEKNKQEYYTSLQNSRAYFELVDLGLSVKWGNLNGTYEWGEEDTDFNTETHLRDLQNDHLNVVEWASNWSKYNPEDEIRRSGRISSPPFRYFERDYAGRVVCTKYSSSYKSSMGKYAFIGDPDNKYLIRALLFTRKHKNQDFATPDEQKEWEERIKEHPAHIPTKAEWQELMDNCTVSGIETVPARSLRYFGGLWYNKDRYYDRRILRLTSKINGNTILFPFDSELGAYYDVLSVTNIIDPHKRILVYVDSTGLSFKEEERSETPKLRCAGARIVHGKINNYDELKSELDTFKKEQEVLAQEYEEQLMNEVITLGPPSFFVKSRSEYGSCVVEVKAPVISGIYTGDNHVYCYVDVSGTSPVDLFKNYHHEVKIIGEKGEKPEYVVKEISLSAKTYAGSPIENHSIYFVSDNNVGKCSEGYFYDDFLRSYEYKTYYTGKHANYLNEMVDRRLLISPKTVFKVNEDKTVKYISGSVPPTPFTITSPELVSVGAYQFKDSTGIQVGVPIILAPGTPKGKKTVKYHEVEIGFDIKDFASPADNSRIQSFDLAVKGGEKEKIKITYNGESGTTHKYIIASMTAGQTYLVEGCVKDENGKESRTSASLVLNPDPNEPAAIELHKVAACFDVKHIDWPFVLSTIQSYNMTVTGSVDEQVKMEHTGDSGDTRNYVIETLTVGEPYTFEGYAIDATGEEYRSKAIITLKPDGSFSVMNDEGNN